jgi:hypothetical protein
MNVELTEIEILMLRGLDAKPALDIPGGIVDDNMDGYSESLSQRCSYSGRSAMRAALVVDLSCLAAQCAFRR